MKSTSPLLFSPIQIALAAGTAVVEDDQADEKAGHAVEVVLRPLLKGMIVAAGALKLSAEEDPADGHGRFFRLVAELD